ncbi:MAG: trypsin-like serine protease [Thermoleophilaceae bacterium]|nr:trypsin-like serine protease [Thermoleophilaceae bacterium]
MNRSRLLLRTFALACSLVVSLIWVGAVQADPSVDIVGGTPAASMDDWPFVVGVLSSSDPYSQYCMGTLVSQRWVLTTRTCVDDEGGYPAPTHVFTGSIDLDDSDGDVTAVSDVILNPNYDEESGTYNLALLRLASPAPAPAVPIEIAGIGDSVPSSGATVEVAGWGDIAGDGSNFSTLLMEAELTTNWSACDLGGGSNGQNFCAGHPSTGPTDDARGICFGDEGAPAVYDFGSGPRLAGIGSWFADCEDPGLFGTLRDHGDWIHEVIAHSVRFNVPRVDFGDIIWGGAEPIRSAAVTNIGEEPITTGHAYFSYDTSGNNNGSYSRMAYDNCAGRTIPVGGTCDFAMIHSSNVSEPANGRIVFYVGPSGLASRAIPYTARMGGDSRAKSYLLASPSKVKLDPSKGKKRGRRYIEAGVRIYPAAPWFNGGPVFFCDGFVNLQVTYPGQKKPKTHRLQLGQIPIPKSKATFCGQKLKMYLPKGIKLPKKPKKLNATFTASFDGNGVLQPAAFAQKSPVSF